LHLLDPARTAPCPCRLELEAAMIRLLVDSPDPGTVLFLRGRLAADHFRVTSVGLDTDFLDLVRRERPHLVVIDHVDERQDLARARIAELKGFCPDVRVIAVSGNPSVRDAAVIEQGVFYYLTLPVGRELVRVIEAGANAVREDSGNGSVRE
jgi:DNA-binding NtrC family response regulator